MSNEDFQRAVLSRFDRLDTELTGIKQEMSGMKKEITGMKTEMSGMKKDIFGLKTEVAGVKTKVTEIDVKLNAVYSQTAMLTEFKTEVNAKLDKIIEDNRSIYEILGEHEVAIRTLRRRPV